MIVQWQSLWPVWPEFCPMAIALASLARVQDWLALLDPFGESDLQSVMDHLDHYDPNKK
jgi:hypothetical protein